METRSRARLVDRNLFDLLNERYGSNAASAKGRRLGDNDAAPQVRARQAIMRPGEDEPAFQRICYDYNPDGTCNVFNHAPNERGRARRTSSEVERQMEARLTALDRRINDRERLPDDARVIDDVTGAEIRRAWNRVRWHIDPTGTRYRNRGVGEVRRDAAGRPNVHTWFSEIDARQATRGGQNYHALHDGAGHALARAIEEENDDYFAHTIDPLWRNRPYGPGNPHFERQERRATRRAQALARWLHEDFTYPAERGY